MTVAGSDIRATFRARRRALSDAEQRAGAEALVRQLAPWIEASTPGTAAAYVATDGEISPSLVVDRLRSAGWQIAYPRVAVDHIAFHLVADEAELIEGPWQLLEPTSSAPMAPNTSLDVVLTPLVGFDAACTRIGRGKAYYDRAFAFRLDTARRPQPTLIGLAHDVQRVDALRRAPHDVPMDAIVTPRHVFGSLHPRT